MTTYIRQLLENFATDRVLLLANLVLAIIVVAIVAPRVLRWAGFFKRDPGAITGFVFQGSSASYISQGKTEMMIPEWGWVIKPNLSADHKVVSFTINSPTTHNEWHLELAAPRRKKLGVGEYNGATRYPFQNGAEPGLAFSGCGRGNNRLAGRFTVLEMTIENGDLVSFAANFVQHDEEREEQWNHGCIRFNSNFCFCTEPAPES